ncbi:hypothetical protein H5410_025285 [Solanum commersonii]|uniref:Uncharacterized protein n=1 Tax=Solanum commersonii TaxID=4109 RepID=A0A9J5YTC4_SOLCO|nr:hypothetical protein H5410_025285 [Solanum commersonii]
MILVYFQFSNHWALYVFIYYHGLSASEIGMVEVAEKIADFGRSISWQFFQCNVFCSIDIYQGFDARFSDLDA